MVDTLENNAQHLHEELQWFAKVLDTRLKLYFGHECEYTAIEDVQPPALDPALSVYSNFLQHYQPTFEERITLVLSLVPHINPQMLDVFFVKNSNHDRGFSEFGGITGKAHGGFIPTGETAMFILAGDNLKKRFYYYYLFEGDHFFSKHQILYLQPAPEGDPFLSGPLSLSRGFLDLFTTGKEHKPNFSIDFPAKLITTELDWKDLVLDQNTLEQIDEIKAWMDYGHIILDDWELNRKLRPGFRALFHGPPGTGKTMTASLLGKSTQRDVYRIDLSMIISKYIGETEKNLEKIFKYAENKQCILFFDEADALFGKRTNVSDSHDKYANQEVSYLLQRIEDFPGVVILATNLKSNLDEAFTRRFESIIHFQIPRYEERFLLWKNGFSKKSSLHNSIDLNAMAGKYELTGGAIMNIVRYSSLMAVKRQDTTITLLDLEEGIRKEFEKDGRTL